MAKSASEAADSYVAEDGYWHTPCPLVATQHAVRIAWGWLLRCDAWHAGTRQPNAAAGWRVDDAGKWVECNRPCPLCSLGPSEPGVKAMPFALPTTAMTLTGDRRPVTECCCTDSWEVGRWLGAKRGVLHERCENGVRTQTLSTCAPATECDTKITATRNGKAQLRCAPESSRVPNGTSINLTAEDSSTWPATCTAGSWNVPNVLPKPAKPAASAPDLKFCRAQTRQYTVEGLGKRWVAVKSLRTPMETTSLVM